MSVSLRSWWVSVHALRQRSCEAARRMGKRQFSHSLLAASPQKYLRSRTINTTSYTGYVGDESERSEGSVLWTCQAIVRIEVKFDKLSFCTFLQKTCFQIIRVTISSDLSKKYVRPNVFKAKSIVIVVSRRIRFYAGITFLNIQLAITFLFP